MGVQHRRLTEAEAELDRRGRTQRRMERGGSGGKRSRSRRLFLLLDNYKKQLSYLVRLAPETLKPQGLQAANFGND